MPNGRHKTHMYVCGVRACGVYERLCVNYSVQQNREVRKNKNGYIKYITLSHKKKAKRRNRSQCAPYIQYKHTHIHTHVPHHTQG